jgi:NADH-quinone oxidoreductase subunit L
MQEYTWGYIWLIPFFPMVGAAINGLFGRRFGRGLVYAIGCGSIFLSFCVSVGAFLTLRGLDPSQRVLTQTLFEWIAAGSTTVNLGYLVDPLSCVMILVVTGVGFLIHVYSTGYMGHDPDYARFFTYLNLFCFAMLTLVLGDNFLVMFVGWEGVGLCSYLLIGFWFEDGAKAAAGMKAFIVNRIGDFGFLLGMFLVFVYFGTLDFRAIMSQAPQVLAVGGAVVTAITLLMFVGATGKSAQIPLYVWLPDAMAGPTPVSALIHAATMVTAGVYMIGRCNVLFSMAPTTMAVVATVGAITAIYAGTIALTQNDIKKVLAYSTVSQLGYMFIGMGVGAYAAGIFHLMTHAFFKACLFLGSGSVIHGMHEEQDMRKMGGLRKYMPHTYITFLIATIAIAGVPPLAAFFSKDEILWKAWANGFKFQWFLGFAAAGITAFYMFRLVFMTFFGKERFDPAEVHVHESPKSMYMPLYALAILSIVGGWIGIPAALGGANQFEHWLAPVTEAYSSQESARAAAELVGDGGLGLATAWASGGAPSAGETAAGNAGGGHHDPTEYILMFLSVANGLLGILVAYFLYILKPEIPKAVAARFKAFYELLLNKYYVDEIYQAVFVDTCLMLATFFYAIWDVVVIDGIVNGAGFVAKTVGGGLRQVQTGKLQGYALTILFGVVVLVAYYALAAAF